MLRADCATGPFYRSPVRPLRARIAPGNSFQRICFKEDFPMPNDLLIGLQSRSRTGSQGIPPDILSVFARV